MDDYDFDEDLRPGKIFFLDTNLSSPVLIHEIQNTKNLIEGLILRVKKPSVYYREVPFHQQGKINFLLKLSKVRKWTVKTLSLFGPLMPERYPELEEGMISDQGSTESLYETSKDAASELENALKAGLTNRGLPIEEIDGVSSLFGTSECLPYRSAYEQFCNLFGRAESRVKMSPHMWTLGAVGKVKFWINSESGLIEYNGERYYSSINQILMLKDKLATRYMMLEHVKPLGLSPSLIDSLLELFQWQDATLRVYSNQAYTLLKAVEPMFKTWLSHITDNVFGNDTAYTRMMVKMKDKEESVCRILKIKPMGMIAKLSIIVEKVRDTRNIVEMFGCLKTSGHPLIDPELGGLSSADAAREPDKTSLTDAQLLRNTFCNIILTAYIEKHGKWPKLYHGNQNTVLKKLNDRQQRNLPRGCYPLEDWNTTEWTKLFDFDYFPNYLELMDDKSISLYRSEKHLTWDKGKPSSERRLLLEILRNKDIDIKTIIKRVSAGDIPWEWLIVSLYPKEREFKLDPRMFAMLVWEMRAFFTTIEANIANSIFRYMPQQTMTKSKTQNQARLLKFTDPNRRGNAYPLFLEIDLTRWNLKWRQLVIHMLGHDLNCMFGTPGTFTVTHKFFSDAQIVVRVSGLRPKGIEKADPPESSLAWRNHLGGFEGLNQKLWTAATYAMVEMALDPLLKDGTISDYEVLGQGDNQIVRVSIPPKDREREDIIPEVRDKVNIRLESACSSVGQEVKPEENIESTSVLTYSKDVLVLGVEYPTSLKKHSRLFPVTSTDFPSVTGNTRAILAGAVAGGENSLYPLRSALIGHYHAYRYIKSACSGYSIHGKGYPNMSHKQIQACLTLPSSIGGLCGPAYASFFYKGGSDPLGKEISGLRLLACSSNLIGRLASSSLRSLEDRYMIDPNPNLDILIDNPYGLPLDTESSPLSKIGHLTLDAFKNRVKNKDIDILIKAGSKSGAEMELRGDLIKTRPLNPLLIHELYEASGFGSIRVMKKMFVHTRTIQTIAQITNPLITHTFLRADKNEVGNFLSWVNGLVTGVYSGKSSCALTKLFRSYWGLELHGVDSEQPLDFTHKVSVNRSVSGIIWSSHSTVHTLDKRGPLSGYIGTATKEKRSDHGYKIVDTGVPSRSVMKLQLLRSQAYGNRNFNNLLDQISLTRTPIALSAVTDILPKIKGGSISHKLNSSVREMSASYVGPLNFATHIRLDTDNIDTISGSTLDYNVMLQEFIVVTMKGAMMLNHHRGATSGYLELPFSDLVPLEDDNFECGDTTFVHTTLPKSKLIYSESLSLKRTIDTEAGAVPSGSIIIPADYSSMKNIKRAALGFFLATLRDGNRAKTIADTRGIGSIPARYQMDISEAHALGPRIIATSIAEAIIWTSIRDTFRTLQLHPERWNESLFMAHNIAICIKACSNYFNHPLAKVHKDYSMIKSGELRYSRTSSLVKKLTGYIRREISLIFSNMDHGFWSSVYPVFSDDQPGSLVEAVSTSAARSLRQLYIIGYPYASEFSSLFSGYLRLAKKHQSQGLTLETLRLRLSQLSVIYRKKGDAELSKLFLCHSHLKGICMFNDDQRTVLRYARSLKPQLMEPLRPRIKPLIPPHGVRMDCCRNCYPTPVSTETVMWNRYRNRPMGGDVTSGYTWIKLLPEITVLPSCLIVGSGNGGLADLLLTCFKTSVIGLDLEEDMPSDKATLLNYIPLGIKYENRPGFIQSDISINTSGDWLEESVRYLTLNSLPSRSTVFLDMTGPSPDQILGTVKGICNHDSADDIWIRLIGSPVDIDAAIATYCKNLEYLQYTVSRSQHSIEIIIHISLRKLPVHLCSHDKPQLIDIPHTEFEHGLIGGSRGSLLDAATLSVFHWKEESLHEAHAVLRTLCSQLLNHSRDRQLSYNDRINLIVAYSTLYAAVSDDPAFTISDWIASESIETDLFEFRISQSVITHLIKYCARLSGLG